MQCQSYGWRPCPGENEDPAENTGQCNCGEHGGSKGQEGTRRGYMPRLPLSRWVPGFGTEQVMGARHHHPIAAHCTTSPGAWGRVLKSMTSSFSITSIPCLSLLFKAALPEIVHCLCCSLLIHEHILPVHHGEGIEHRAQGLNGCRSNVGQKGPSPHSSHPAPLAHTSHVPRETPMLGPILRREWTRITVPHTTSQEKWPGTNCIVAARYPRGAQLSSAA